MQPCARRNKLAKLPKQTSSVSDLFYTAVNPTPRAEVGEDVRILQVDLKRSRLPSLDAIKTALDIYFKEGKSPEAIEGLRRVLLSTITENEELAKLLNCPELTLLHNRLKELTEQPTDRDDDNKVLNLPLFPIEPFLLPLSLDLNTSLFSHNKFHQSNPTKNSALQHLCAYSAHGLTRP
jgi:hypothetical protein